MFPFKRNVPALCALAILLLAAWVATAPTPTDAITYTGTWVPNIHTPIKGQPFFEPPPGHCPLGQICADWEELDGTRTACCIDPEELGGHDAFACAAWRPSIPLVR